MTIPTLPRWNTDGTGDGVGPGDTIPDQVKADGVEYGDLIPATWANRLFRRAHGALDWIIGGEAFDLSGAPRTDRLGRSVYTRGVDLVNSAVLTNLVEHAIDGDVVDPYPRTHTFVEFEAFIYVVDGTGAADLVLQFRRGGSVRGSILVLAAALNTGDWWHVKYREAIDTTAGAPGARPSEYFIETEFKGLARVVTGASGTWNTQTDEGLIVEAVWSGADPNSSVRLGWAKAHLVNQ